jgi:hypothetical protein
VRLILRTLIGAFLVFLGIAGVSYMQKRFDASDEKRALQAVVAKIPDVPEPSSCRAEMSSRAKGDVRVVCGNRSWIVNVLSAKIAEETK